MAACRWQARGAWGPCGPEPDRRGIRTPGWSAIMGRSGSRVILAVLASLAVPTGRVPISDAVAAWGPAPGPSRPCLWSDAGPCLGQAAAGGGGHGQDQSVRRGLLPPQLQVESLYNPHWHWLIESLYNLNPHWHWLRLLCAATNADMDGRGGRSDPRGEGTGARAEPWGLLRAGVMPRVAMIPSHHRSGGWPQVWLAVNSRPD